MTSKGLDPNASFRNPVELNSEAPKILVEVDVLDWLLSFFGDTPKGPNPFAALIREKIDPLREAINAARKAQEAHRGD